jgi:UDP-N-acetylmuramoylalanine--D-glutamate ligase
MQQPAVGKTLIVGLGKTGLSCARYLSARGIQVAVVDSRENPPGLAELQRDLPDIALFLGGFDPAAFAEAERLVVSPGVSLHEPMIQLAMERGASIIGDIELFADEANAPVAAITGSNGKSSVTTLVGEMAAQAGLEVKVGGNLGEPALELLHPGCELYVLELSSFQLETLSSLQPEVAVVLNISADHMDRYRDLDEYAKTKARIYGAAVIRVFNRDDPQVMAMSQGGKDELFFTLKEPGENTFGIRRAGGVDWICFGEERLIDAAELLTPGSHNLANALAALAVGTALKLPRVAMLATLRHFCGLPHRTQLVAEVDGVKWYNDSKGTNVGAAMAALNGVAEPGGGRTVMLLGGESKGADFSPLVPLLAASGRAVVLLGRDALQIATTVAGSVPMFMAEDMEDAVKIAATQALPGDRVLLSPACASFDMFSGFEQRGERFIEAVGRLGNG